jgi:hypothetical protein
MIMKTVDELFVEQFADRMDKNLKVHLEVNKELLKEDCVMAKKKWEPNKAPNPYYD